MRATARERETDDRSCVCVCRCGRRRCDVIKLTLAFCFLVFFGCACRPPERASPPPLGALLVRPSFRLGGGWLVSGAVLDWLSPVEHQPLLEFRWSISDAATINKHRRWRERTQRLQLLRTALKLRREVTPELCSDTEKERIQQQQ